MTSFFIKILLPGGNEKLTSTHQSNFMAKSIIWLLRFFISVNMWICPVCVKDVACEASG